MTIDIKTNNKVKQANVYLLPLLCICPAFRALHFDENFETWSLAKIGQVKE